LVRRDLGRTYTVGHEKFSKEDGYGLPAPVTVPF
jgi:hypothetical protein